MKKTQVSREKTLKRTSKSTSLLSGLYSLVVAGAAVAGMVLVHGIPVIPVVLGRLMPAGPALMIEKVVVTRDAFVVTTKMYVPPD